MLQVTRLDSYFELLIGGDSLPEKKPHASVLRHVAQHFGIAMSRYAQLGDSAVDVAAACNAGMAAWAVPYGYNAGAPSGPPWRWSAERYGELLTVAGGRERLLQDMTTRGDAPPLAAERAALARAVHERKNRLYAGIIESSGIALRPGVMELLQECRAAGVRMAITTTTSRANVDALLQAHLGAAWTSWFAALVCGEDVPTKKPDPEVYVAALRRLQLGPFRPWRSKTRRAAWPRLALPTCRCWWRAAPASASRPSWARSPSGPAWASATAGRTQRRSGQPLGASC